MKTDSNITANAYLWHDAAGRACTDVICSICLLDPATAAVYADGGEPADLRRHGEWDIWHDAIGDSLRHYTLDCCQCGHTISEEYSDEAWTWRRAKKVQP